MPIRLLLVLLLAFAPAAMAQVDEAAPAVSARVYAERSQRLREFGYPELARAQLDEAARLYPTEKPAVLEHVRLLTETRAGIDEIEPWIRIIQQKFADDFDCALELATWLYVNERPPLPPEVDSEAKLKGALERLGAEMAVYRELAQFIAAPGDELPDSAKGNPALPLAYLARCAQAKPGNTDVLDFSARYIDMLARRFQEWSLDDESLSAFHVAAIELFELSIPLFQRAAADSAHTPFARQRLTETYYRLGRIAEAKEQAAASDLLTPNSMRVAGILQAIAEDTTDYALLVEALERQSRVFRDEESRLNVLAAMRVAKHEWPMEVWHAWREMMDLPGHHRASAAALLLREKPEFLEVHFFDAGIRVEAAMAAQPHEAAPYLQSALNALERCSELKDIHADWHGLRATILWHMGRYKEASEAFRALADAAPEDDRAARYAQAAADIAEGKYTAADWVNYRRQLEDVGDFREKLREVKAICARSPQFFAAQLLLSRIALMLEDFEASLEAATAALEQSPENLECLENGAWAAMWLGKYGQSAGLFLRLNEAREGYRDAGRWHSLVSWAAAATEPEQNAFSLWLESTKKQLSPTERRRKLEEAAKLAPQFPEPALELATLERQRGEYEAAEALLNRALENGRDRWVRAAIHRTRGNLFAAGRRLERAVSEYETAYSLDRGDGSDLLFAALALHAAGDNANASAAMRKLFAESPSTPLLRPTNQEAFQLDLVPADAGRLQESAPAYGVGDHISFRAQIAVSGEGMGQLSNELKLEFDLSVEVVEVPRHGGVWELKLTFGNPPSPEWNALDGLQTTLQVSPWFGLCAEPAVAALPDVVNPVIQALVEGFTAGLGDAALPTPAVWKNTMTKGPPHFSANDPEGACLERVTGDSFSIVRRAMAGRKLGSQAAADATFSRVLEARVEAGGARRALRRVSFEIARQELAPERNDVIRSRLEVAITAK